MKWSAIKAKITLWSRYCHGFIGMACVFMVGFFALTGFMLNHSNWFALDDSNETTICVPLPVDYPFEAPQSVQLSVLRDQLDIHGQLESWKQQKNNEITVVLSRPGERTELNFIAEKNAEVTIIRDVSPWCRLTDLHKGQACSSVWKRVIDIVAISLLALCLTGFICDLLSVKNRWRALLALGVAGAIILTVYLLVF